jgi:uncharacterized protein (DUF934 family)
MRFIQPRRDPWRRLGGDDGPPVYIQPTPNLLLDVAQWHAFRSQWPANMAVGVALANDFDVEGIAADLPRLALVALHFPKWADGRAYTQARLLRARWRFGGEVRATGEVLVDMLPLLRRTGFDAVVLRADQSEEAARRALEIFDAHYQGDVVDPQPLFRRPSAERESAARRPPKEFVSAGEGI